MVKEFFSKKRNPLFAKFKKQILLLYFSLTELDGVSDGEELLNEYHRPITTLGTGQ